jgi:hypothetical protein
VVLRLFRFPLAVTVLGIAAAGVIGGPSVAGIVAILAVLEISLSFDNAVVNATVLARMDERWQRIFLTLGVIIAVFGMRLIFPIVVVTLSSHLSPGKVLDLALNHPHEYSLHLTAAHPAIAAFGGIFLMMIFLDFLFEEREITWLGPIERPLAKVGKLDQVSVVIALVFLIIASTTFAKAHALQVLVSGVAGLATYIGVSSLSALFEGESDESDDAEAGDADDGDVPHIRVPQSLARAGLFAFLYLEVLDASFSFDGVVGAFAITDRIFVIALGLGIGACYIRALTVYLVRKGTLGDYVHLEHGAHWAIGSLAVLLFVTIAHTVPEAVTGLIGIGFIGAALISSIVRNRRNRDGDASDPATELSSLPSATAGL